VTGTVDVEAGIDAGGNAGKARAVSGLILRRGAADGALRQWKFKPASIDGQKVSSRACKSVAFGLQ